MKPGNRRSLIAAVLILAESPGKHAWRILRDERGAYWNVMTFLPRREVFLVIAGFRIDMISD